MLNGSRCSLLIAIAWQLQTCNKMYDIPCFHSNLNIVTFFVIIVNQHQLLHGIYIGLFYNLCKYYVFCSMQINTVTWHAFLCYSISFFVVVDILVAIGSIIHYFHWCNICRIAVHKPVVVCTTCPLSENDYCPMLFPCSWRVSLRQSPLPTQPTAVLLSWQIVQTPASRTCIWQHRPFFLCALWQGENGKMLHIVTECIQGGHTSHPGSYLQPSSPKGARYTLLLDGGLVKGWGSKDSWLLIVCHD